MFKTKRRQALAEHLDILAALKRGNQDNVASVHNSKVFNSQ